jgi:GT2 family glycosyltransferase
MMRKPHSGSIIMPVFNRAGLLDRALRNLLRQTYRNSEIIVIDDAGSSVQRYPFLRK